MRHVDIVVERSTLGQDEVDARRAGVLAVVPDVFRSWLMDLRRRSWGVGSGFAAVGESPVGGLSLTCVAGNTPSETVITAGGTAVHIRLRRGFRADRCGVRVLGGHGVLHG
jgi:hypothetical protein